MAHDVFVSHSVKDKAVAEKVVARLEAESVRCWVAPRDVMPGADWGESIIDAIESSRIMVLVFSKNANGSSQIKREVERAVDKEVYTIPFRIDDIEPTRSLEYFISTSQWMDAFTRPIEPHLDRLARTVKAVLAKESPVVALEIHQPPNPIPKDATPNRTHETRPHLPEWVKPAAIVAGLLILAAAIWYPLNQKRARPEEAKAKSVAVADPSLLTLSPTTESPPPISNPAANSAQDYAEQPEVLNQPSKVRPQPPAEMMNKLAQPVVTPDPTEIAKPSAPKKGFDRPDAIPNEAARMSPESKGTNPSRDLRTTTWNHNGSTVILRKDGSQLSFVYRRIRPGLEGIIPDGATLFQGIAVGDRYNGKARRFKKGFPMIEYEVSGGFLDGGRVIELKGKAPKRDESGTIAGYEPETLRFEYLGSAE